MTARNSVASRRASQYERSARELTDDEKARLDRIRTAPRKYEDRERTILTAEYLYWREAHRREVAPTVEEQAYDFFHDPRNPHAGDGPANHAMYFPEEYDKELGDGSWVFAIDPPVTEQWSRFKVPILSIWWARPHVLNVGQIGGRLPYQGVIQTPAGDLHLWPHEYTICKDVQGMLGEPGVEIHTLGGEPLLDEDQLFYLSSRGIHRRDAIVMLWDQIETGDFAYITLPDYAVEVFAGVGTRVMGGVRQRYEEGVYA